VSTKLAIVAPTFKGSFATELQRHLFDLAGRCHIEGLTDDPGEQTTRLGNIQRRVNPRALIAISVRPSAAMIELYQAANVPFVLVDEEAPGVASISTDNEAGGYLAGQHLLSTGRRFLSVITGRVNVAGGLNAKLRLAGFRRALTEARLTHTIHVEVVDYSKRDGEECFARASEHADGVFCAAGDTCATGLIAAARVRKIRVPGDFGIVGYDNDMPLAEIMGLTTIRQPIREMAEAAYRMVIAEPSRTLASPQKLVFTPELIIRESTAEITTKTRKAS
jgi:DNA-binding LacI/PurR family transcriptional regulator